MPFKPHPTDPTKVIYKTNDYWIPKPWQGLTQEERDELLNGSTRIPSRLIDWVEQKLKEKNGAT